MLKVKSSKYFGYLCLMFIISLLSYQNVIAQKSRDGFIGAEDLKYNNIQVSNGILVFQNQEAFNAVYRDLEEKTRLDLRDESNFDIPEFEDDPVLNVFEQQFPGYTSLRKDQLLKEETFLSRGGDPKNFIADDLTIDSEYSALINKDRLIKMGNSIFFFPKNTGSVYQVTDGDMRTIGLLKEGKNPYLLTNVIIIEDPSADDDCSASFGVNGATIGLEHSFTFTGKPTALSHPGATIKYHWTFGDGSSSEEMNPSHTYSKSGDYAVCVIVEMLKKDSTYCTDKLCQVIKVQEEQVQDTTPFCQGAALFLWNETGNPGEVCFTPVGGNYYGNIISYTWTFGDGSTPSNDQNPCNTYQCDLDNVLVSLTVTLDNGCTDTKTEPVNITSHSCCERSAKSSGEQFYGSNKKFSWIQKTKHLLGGFNKVYVKMINYKHNGNRWKRDKGHLKVTTYGYVFTESAAGCGCKNPYNVAATEVEPNAKKLVLKKDTSKKNKTKKGDEWGAKYFISNSKKLDTTTSVACD